MRMKWFEKTAGSPVTPAVFWGLWGTSFLLLSSDRYVKSLNLFLNTKQTVPYVTLASLIAFFRYVAPVLYGLGFRARRPWRLLFLGGAASILLLVGQVSPYMDQATDRDEALRIGIETLLAGESPYRHTTSLGNPLSPLPGALLLAAPSYFVTGRGSSFATVVLVLYGLLIYRRLMKFEWAPIVVVALWLNHFTAMNAFYGGDFLLMIVLLSLVFEGLLARRGWLAGIALGLGLSCRTAGAFVIGAPFLVHACTSRSKPLWVSLSVGVAICAALILPVLILDPSAMYQATLALPGVEKLSFAHGGNLFLQPFLYLRSAAGGYYQILTAVTIFLVQTWIVVRQRSLTSVLVAQTAGFLMVCFFISSDHHLAVDYLSVPAACLPYLFALNAATGGADAICVRTNIGDAARTR